MSFIKTWFAANTDLNVNALRNVPMGNLHLRSHSKKNVPLDELRCICRLTKWALKRLEPPPLRSYELTAERKQNFKESRLDRKKQTKRHCRKQLWKSEKKKPPTKNPARLKSKSQWRVTCGAAWLMAAATRGSGLLSDRIVLAADGVLEHGHSTSTWLGRSQMARGQD